MWSDYRDLKEKSERVKILVKQHEIVSNLLIYTTNSQEGTLERKFYFDTVAEENQIEMVFVFSLWSLNIAELEKIVSYLQESILQNLNRQGGMHLYVSFISN